MMVFRMKVSILAAIIAMSSFSGIVFATVDHTQGQIVGKAADGTYSVDHGNSVWSGIGADEVTAQQVKSYQMNEALKEAEKNQSAVVKNKSVSTPFVSYKGGNRQSDNHSHNEHGSGNGGNNATNSHSAHGLGGSDHVGGGRSGGGFHY